MSIPRAAGDRLLHALRSTPLRGAALLAIAVGATVGTSLTVSVATPAGATAESVRPGCTMTPRLVNRTRVLALTATGLRHHASFEVLWATPAGTQRQNTSSDGAGVLRLTLTSRGTGSYTAVVSPLGPARSSLQTSCHATVSSAGAPAPPSPGIPTPIATPNPTAPAPALSAPASTSLSTPASTTSAPPTPRAPWPPATAPPLPTPRPGGWPGPANTGVPPGTVLTPSGSVTVTTDGAVINALDIQGCLEIRANNVTVKNTRIHAGVCYLQVRVDGVGALIEDTEIDGAGTQGANSPNDGSAIGFGGFRALRVNLHGNINGVACGSACTIQDSWIHDLDHTNLSHNQDILSNGDTAGITIRHNRLDNQINQTGTIDLFGDFGPVTNVVVDDNLLNGGGFAVYGGCDPLKPYGNQCQNISFTNNRFARGFFPLGGYWGPVTSFNGKSVGSSGDDSSYRAAHSLTWAGNVWDDSGAPVGL